MAKYSFERIANGLLMHDGEKTLYFTSFKLALEYLADDLVDNYKEAMHHEWDGKFSISLETEGLL